MVESFESGNRLIEIRLRVAAPFLNLRITIKIIAKNCAHTNFVLWNRRLA